MLTSLTRLTTLNKLNKLNKLTKLTKLSKSTKLTKLTKSINLNTLVFRPLDSLMIGLNSCPHLFRYHGGS